MFNYTNIASDRIEYVSIAQLSDLPNGERLFVEIDELALVVFNIAGKLFAIADRCSHDDGPLGDGELENFEITCPRHGASFDVTTGKVLSLPAVEDIPAYPIRVQDGEIQVGIPLK